MANGEWRTANAERNHATRRGFQPRRPAPDRLADIRAKLELSARSPEDQDTGKILCLG
jgi:hypothetical protein